MRRKMARAEPLVSPLLWSAAMRVAVAAMAVLGLWVVVGWALDWWQ